jgi:UDPglucose--hexose-1-phosphate uridylyltransferase
MLQKTRTTKPDGRYLLYYSFDRPPPVPSAPTGGPARGLGSLELRWNPLVEEWVVVATERQERTFLPPPEYCPFCPTRDPSLATEVPSPDYEIVALENRFPSFRPDAPEPEASSSHLRRRTAARGLCEVILYSSEHDATLAGLSQPRVRHLVDVWADRYRELGTRDDVQYVYIFENRGEEIGVTLSHPHGQIYAFPYLPPRIQKKLAAEAIHHQRTGRCLHCDLLADELADGRRVVAQQDDVVAFVPFAARFPYEVQIVGRTHRPSLDALTAHERRALAGTLQTILQKYDALWGLPMPYMLAMHQSPTDGVERPSSHLHVELMPLRRSRDKLKYLAGSETGAGTFINDTLPEEKAEELRCAEPRT